MVHSRKEGLVHSGLTASIPGGDEAGGAFDNDPNQHRTEGKVFRLTFGMWTYRHTVEATVFGNCKGFDNLESAIANVADTLPEGDWGHDMVLTDAEGDTLHASSEDDDVEEWLMENLVSAEIVGFAKRPADPIHRRDGDEVGVNQASLPSQSEVG